MAKTYSVHGKEMVRGKLAVLTPGMGAVATTFFAGVEAIKMGLAKPIGSYTQLAEIHLGREEDEESGRGTRLNETPPARGLKRVKEILPLASLDQLEFGGWDPIPANAYEAAKEARVLDGPLLERLKEPLERIQPMTAVFDQNYVRRLSGSHVKTGPTKMDLADQLRADIRRFMQEKNCDRAVMIWCGSTEVYSQPSEVHQSLKAFEQGLLSNHPAISPSQIYAYAALKERVPYANGSPNVSVDMPYLQELSFLSRTPICGSDFKTGQTFMKTVIAPGLRNRQLGVSGWFSTNILGNRDGDVLHDEGSFRSKEVTKMGVLNDILSAERQPDLYGDLQHIVRINYYRPRGDNKEGWDNIDIFGWLGYPMQIKVNFLCRDSILAAPIVLDLALWMDLAARNQRFGIQEWLSFYFKSPLASPGTRPEHDLSVQLIRLENEIRKFVAENGESYALPRGSKIRSRIGDEVRIGN